MNFHYLGPIGSYSHIAAEYWQQAHHDQLLTLVPQKTFSDIYAQIGKYHDIGIIPLENSTTSNLHENIDTLFSQKFHIIGELYLHINLHVFSLKHSNMSDITTVLSHPKALEQIHDVIQDYGWTTIPMQSTAEAAERMIEETKKEWAVIGSKALMEHYPKLFIQKEYIGNTQNNYTRFVVIQYRKDTIYHTGHNKATYVFTTLHIPGALVHVLAPLAKAGFNLTKIESRPIPHEPWNYAFWIDVTTKDSFSLKKTEIIMQKHCASYTLLGTYQKGSMYES